MRRPRPAVQAGGVSFSALPLADAPYHASIPHHRRSALTPPPSDDTHPAPARCTCKERSPADICEACRGKSQDVLCELPDGLTSARGTPSTPGRTRARAARTGTVRWAVGQKKNSRTRGRASRSRQAARGPFRAVPFAGASIIASPPSHQAPDARFRGRRGPSRRVPRPACRRAYPRHGIGIMTGFISYPMCDRAPPRR